MKNNNKIYTSLIFEYTPRSGVPIIILTLSALLSIMILKYYNFLMASFDSFGEIFFSATMDIIILCILSFVAISYYYSLYLIIMYSNLIRLRFGTKTLCLFQN